MKRREALKRLAGIGAMAAAGTRVFPAPSQGNATVRQAIAAYLETLARNDGGYGWQGQARSHLTPTFHVIGCYRLLGKMPPRRGLADFVRTHHPTALKKLEQERRLYDWQQVQALVWLGEDPGDFKSKVLGWKEPLAYLRQYERHGYPLFPSEASVILARGLLGVDPKDLPASFTEYLAVRRRANGSFNNTPAADGGDGHVVNTLWGLLALTSLGRALEKAEQTREWIRACQLQSGGFTFAPRPEFGGIEDVAFTQAATRGLRLLGGEPANREACIAWLQSLWNSDGGFGDRPGWASNPMATHYAMDALEALGALDEFLERRGVSGKTSPRRPSPPDDYQVFTIQIEAHGRGSPAEAVDLANSLRIHLWGAKNARRQWLARAQALADERGIRTRFFVSNEEYGTWVSVPGMGVYSHTSDIIAPAGVEIGPSLAGERAVSWQEFRDRRLAPLEAAKGRLIWQFGENEELVRMFLDDSLERGGYAAISTYHFGNPDFTNSEPFLHRWRGRIPFVALQDAHGNEPWWFADMTEGFRTVFLGREPTWDAWLHALDRNWVAAIRHDVWTGGQTWMHAGSEEIADFIRARENQWRWWDNPDIGRPMLSIVAVRPEDAFETARPQTGVTLRIRAAWTNTTQGLPKQPIARFERLLVDGAETTPEVVERRRPNGALEDHYHALHLPSLKSGAHTATAIGRVLKTDTEVRRTIEFVV